MTERVIAPRSNPSVKYNARGNSSLSPKSRGRSFYSEKVKAVHTLDEATKVMEKGDILVTENINRSKKPKWIPKIRGLV